ncbi:calmodulin-lysine N-methyltransferase [Punica granatum]|uniref:Calmodulin-lysine N-methyltransferase n=2 Tax=Punica granatum TaxID=22663 RepID=A0A6P8CZ74_PUNGR|nr:calmodulin-lysine N-methyltransferase [Punica granatum]PKI34654.1 hypothetical protein CRG98_044968 [Punica granatum]
MEGSTTRASSIRWKILRQALLRTRTDEKSQLGIEKISRKSSSGGFKLIPFQVVDRGAQARNSSDSSSTRKGPDSARDAVVCYTLPAHGSPKLFLTQRLENRGDLHDFEICNQYNIDNTGLVRLWPSEEVLAYYCLSTAEIFCSKRVIELGSGYGLAGLVIAAASEASEVMITDGNPQVVDYIQQSIEVNSRAFGCTRVKSMMLHWNQMELSSSLGTFDVIIASDCTFFKEFHEDLARMVRLLLKGGLSEALFFSPKRGDSLDKFLEEASKQGLKYSITENYSAEVWKRHQESLTGEGSWPGYQKDHSYPLLIRITK